jgi:hypothetical protein
MRIEQSGRTYAPPQWVGALLVAGLGMGALLSISSCEMPELARLRGDSQPGGVAAAPDTESKPISKAVIGSSVVIGEPKTLSTDDYEDGNYLQAQQTSLGQSATIQTLSMYVTRVAGKLRLGIYDATGPNGGPGAKKAETNEITPVVGWNTASAITPVLLPAGTYWLAYVPSSNSLHLRWTNAGTTMYFSYPYGPLPLTFSTQTKRLTNHWSFYATLSLAVAANNTPTVATAASASPNPVVGKTANVSVLGADDGGESGLVYSWSATGPGAVSFTPNATNAAKNSLATFAKAGAYVLQAVIADAQGQTATSTVNVTVNQTLAGITVSPGSTTVAIGGTQQFIASASDQFAVAMLPQPAFAWTASGGGTISSSGLFTAGSTPGGPFTVTAASSSLLGTANVTIAVNSPTVATAASASPNPVLGKTTNVSVLGADDGGEGSLLYSWSATGPSAVSFTPNAANAAKNSLATFTKAGAYVLQAVIADAQGQTASSTVNVTVNQTLAGITVSPGSATVATGGTQQFTASASDQFAVAMLPQPAFAWTVSGGGTISSSGLFTAGSASGGPFTVTAASSSRLGTANVLIMNNSPTVATAASAGPNPVVGETANVSVLGADDGGEGGLIYSWSATGPSAVSFSPNATNAAKNSLATFTKAGAYVLQAAIADTQGQTATSSVNVTVNQTLAGITVSPGSATVATGGTQQFTAFASDQFAVAMLPQPAFAWTASGGGTISSSGLFTAGSTSGGPFTVTAASSSQLGTANVVVAGNPPPTAQTFSTSFPLAENPISEGGSWINGGVVGLDWNNVLTTPGLAQGQGPSSAAYSDPTALLAGNWGPDQTVQATVYSLNQNPDYYQEVELRLRSSLSAHSCAGYEINFRCLQTSDAYMQIVRWNGPIGSFTYISSYSGAQFGVANGDVVKATIVGNVINVYKNGTLIGTGTDSTYATGNPGIGFDFGCGSTYTDFGFTNVTASSP